MASISFKELKSYGKDALNKMYKDMSGRKLHGFKSKKSYIIKKILEKEIETRTAKVSLFNEKDVYIYRNDIEKYDAIGNIESSSDSSESSSDSSERSLTKYVNRTKYVDLTKIISRLTQKDVDLMKFLHR